MVGHVLHPGLGLRRKVAGDVEFAGRLAHQPIDEFARPLPALRRTLDALQDLLVEGEIGVGEGRGQIGRGHRQQTKPQIGLPGVERRRVDQGGDAAQIVGLAHDEADIGRVDALGVQVGRAN